MVERPRSYHCNLCGAWLLVGQPHSCDPARLAVVDRIADFFSGHGSVHDDHDHAAELAELIKRPLLDSGAVVDDDEQQGDS